MEYIPEVDIAAKPDYLKSNNKFVHRVLETDSTQPETQGTDFHQYRS